MHRALIVSLCLAACGFAKAADLAQPAPIEAPRIEVCFVLDTTGSMGGLIDGAKQKIWAITNEIAAAKPAPHVRLALVGYRDRGDAYVTQRFDLTDDLDAIYANLTQFQAGGGGDGPESVNQALHEAVHEIAWSDDDRVLKVIFLVGDAPPHMDYDNDVPYTATCEAAVRRGLIVNTIQCGGDTATTAIWQEIARRSEGAFATIGQSGDVVVIATPMDEELARLSGELNATVMPYGDRMQQEAVSGKLAVSATAAPAAMADRAAYYAGAERGRAVSGRGDLVADYATNEVDDDALASLADEQLPAAMRDMNADERKAHLTQLAAQRDVLQQRISELSVQRQAYLDEQRKQSGAKDGFDEQVAQTIREQAARKGIEYAE